MGRGLLEKMGWKDGQGLGSDGQGIVDPITLKYKNDSKGVGFKGNPDAVLAHQDDFEALLQGLSNQHARYDVVYVCNAHTLTYAGQVFKTWTKLKRFSKLEDFYRLRFLNFTIKINLFLS